MDIDVRDPKFLRWAGAILLVAVAVPMYFMSAMYPFTWASRTETIQGLEARHEELSRDLETGVRNLFAAGDGAGVTRGLVQASASGLVSAREILRRL